MAETGTSIAAASAAGSGVRWAIALGLAAALGTGVLVLAGREGAAPEAEAVAAGEPAATVRERASAEDDAAAGAAEQGAAAGDASARPVAPSFDVVRVAPDGSALVAGRAAPGARVTVRAGDEAVAEVEAAASGEFVAIFRAEPDGTPRALSLESAAAGAPAVPSLETVLLLPPPAPGPGAAVPQAPAASGTAAPREDAAGRAEGAPAEAAPGEAAAAPDAVPAPDAVAREQARDEAEAAPADDDGEPFVAATVVMRPDDEAVEVQPGAATGVPRRVSLASISYGREGLVTLAGLGTAGARVRVYVDGDHSRDAVVSEDGRWSVELGEIAAGVYRLRVDELRDDGTVASRVETPFQRDFPAAPSADDDPRSVTVQPGNNLWTLARVHYGMGVLYSQIFTANAELIRDPDLIHPGQIFVLPEVEGARQPVAGPLARP